MPFTWMRPGKHVAALLCSFVLACSSDGGTGVEPDDVESPRRVTVQPSGGTVESADLEARVVIPAGALGAARTIEVERLRRDEIPAAVLERVPIARAWRFGPEGTQFAGDVEIRIGFDTSELPAGVDLSHLTLVTLGSDGRIELLRDVRISGSASPGGALDPAAASGIRGLISHFSPFAIVPFPRVSGTFHGEVGGEHPWVCTPELPGWGDEPVGQVDLVITQSGHQLSATATGGVHFNGLVNLEDHVVLVATRSLDVPGFTGTERIDVNAQVLAGGGRLLGGFTITETIRNTQTGAMHVCTQFGTFDFARVGS